MAIDPKKARAALAEDFKNISPQTFRQRLDSATPGWAVSAKKKGAKRKPTVVKSSGVVIVPKKAASKKRHSS